MKEKGLNWSMGLGIPLIIALFAKLISTLPFFKIMGFLVLAILLGMLWSAFIKIPKGAEAGIQFSSKKLLRVGIILLGMRLNFMDLIHAGPKIFALSVIDILFALVIVYALARWLGVERKLGILTASGTAICGAAAIAAIAPQVKAKDQEIAISVTIIAVLGTFFTLMYTFLFPFLGLSALNYGVFSGATLHEIAHVMAAAVPGGNSAIDEAIIVKLSRVALLVPVAILIYYLFNKTKASGEKKKGPTLPIPWFIIGFLLASAINTLQVIPQPLTQFIINTAYLFIAMAMAALGLGTNIALFKKIGYKPFIASLIGSILLSLLGYVLVQYGGMGY